MASKTKISKHAGFTIVELLIVIIVIAILAAILTAAYNGIQKRARTSAVSADLINASKKMKLAQVENGAYPISTADLPASPNTSYELTVDNSANPQTFCLTATNSKLSYKATESSPPAEGLCPGHLGGATLVSGTAILRPDITDLSTNWVPSGAPTAHEAVDENVTTATDPSSGTVIGEYVRASSTSNLKLGFATRAVYSATSVTVNIATRTTSFQSGTINLLVDGAVVGSLSQAVAQNYAWRSITYTPAVPLTQAQLDGVQIQFIGDPHPYGSSYYWDVYAVYTDLTYTQLQE